MNVGYMDEVVPEYQAALDKCGSFDDCHSVLERYRELFPDALAAAPRNAVEFDEFRRGLRKERKGTFAGQQWVERFGAVMMPALAIHVAQVAIHFGVPWGLAFNRLVEAGRVKLIDGAYRWATSGVAAPQNGQCVKGKGPCAAVLPDKRCFECLEDGPGVSETVDAARLQGNGGPQ